MDSVHRNEHSLRLFKMRLWSRHWLLYCIYFCNTLLFFKQSKSSIIVINKKKFSSNSSMNKYNWWITEPFQCKIYYFSTKYTYQKLCIVILEKRNSNLIFLKSVFVSKIWTKPISLYDSPYELFHCWICEDLFT